MFDDGINYQVECLFGLLRRRLFFNFVGKDSYSKVGIVYSMSYVRSELLCYAILKGFCADEVALCDFA